MTEPQGQRSQGTGSPGGGSVLEVHAITKRFGSMLALDAVDLEVRAGEVHALLGENGAGKTTLMNVVTGIIEPDDGRIVVRGEEGRTRSPSDAARRGLGMVHQHFRLVANLTVAENVHLGWSETPRTISPGALARRTDELAARFGFSVEPSAKVWQLSVGQRQRVAILRALARGASTLILDEPTAVLTAHETESLFRNVRAMAAEGRTVILISHKLNEVMEVADRVTVPRRGRRVAVSDRSELDSGELVRLMVGRTVDPMRASASVRIPADTPAEQILRAKGVSALDDRNLPALVDVDLTVRAGEILGVAGVSGNGQRELAEVVTGLRRTTGGTIRIGDRDVTDHGSRAFLDAGVGSIPEEVATGLALNASVDQNLVMRAVEMPPVRRGVFIDQRAMRSVAKRLLETANLNGVNGSRHASMVSGGQAQRLIIRRELDAARSLLVAAYPDIGATQTVHRDLLAARDDGVGVMLISEDLDEILRLSDRVLVMYEGRVAGVFARGEFDPERIGSVMAGMPSAPRVDRNEAGGER